MNKSNSRLQRFKLDAGIILGFKDRIFGRDDKSLVSHFYYGIDGRFLMVFLWAIAAEIHHTRSHRWRKIHTILKCIALLLFLCPRVTGSRDLLGIRLS
ncbi:DUF4079 family protein [Microcoleus sp. N9_A1]|uniref:DUF4079 family protein n=1 Tax=Microcoleus sp. N9_A1 TaxID=3055380 RepID=UPI002FD231FE